MSNTQIDTRALYEAIRTRRTLTGVSWRRVADMAGISASALSRLAAGRNLSADGFASLVDWLELPAETFFRRAEPTDVDDDAADEVIDEYAVAVTAHCSTLGVHERDAAASAVRAVQIAITREPLVVPLVDGSERRVRLMAVTETGQAFRDGILQFQAFTRPGARAHR